MPGWSAKRTRRLFRRANVCLLTGREVTEWSETNPTWRHPSRRRPNPSCRTAKHPSQDGRGGIPFALVRCHDAANSSRGSADRPSHPTEQSIAEGPSQAEEVRGGIRWRGGDLAEELCGLTRKQPGQSDWRGRSRCGHLDGPCNAWPTSRSLSEWREGPGHPSTNRFGWPEEGPERLPDSRGLLTGWLGLNVKHSSIVQLDFIAGH